MFEFDEELELDVTALFEEFCDDTVFAGGPFAVFPDDKLCVVAVDVETVAGADEFVAAVEVLVVEADETLAVWVPVWAAFWVALSEFWAGVFWLPE
ncbi:MAG TPA: hypothetical protein VGN23_16390 [Verrucomicrobiae bacterium]